MKNKLPRYITQEDSDKGKHGEDYILENASLLFGCRIKEDRRNDFLEGELVLEDGRLVEVKSDFTPYPLSQNTVTVEIKSTINRDGEGWYPCSVKNGVNLVAWVCYRITADKKPKQLPYWILIVPMECLIALMDLGDEFPRHITRKGDLVSIRIPDILAFCKGEAHFFQSAWPHDSDTRKNFRSIRDTLQALLPPDFGFIAPMPSQYLFQRDTLPETEEDITR